MADDKSEDLEIKWYKNEAEIMPDQRTDIAVKNFMSILTINNVQPVDSGKYECAVKNPSGLVRSTCVVNIKGK